MQPVRDDSDGHQSDSSQSDEDSPCPVLEVLEIPGVKIDDPPDFANALTKFRRLKRLDFSGTSIQGTCGLVIVASDISYLPAICGRRRKTDRQRTI